MGRKTHTFNIFAHLRGYNFIRTLLHNLYYVGKYILLLPKHGVIYLENFIFKFSSLLYIFVVIDDDYKLPDFTEYVTITLQVL